MGRKKPSGDPSSKNYDTDYDANFEYHNEWKGLIYDKDDEDKMMKVMERMPAEKTPFATHKTYLYYSRYYDMLAKMDEIRRVNILNNINKHVEDPMKYKQKYKNSAFSNLGVVNTSLGVGGIVCMVYALRFIKK
eukprot:196097_1